MMQYLAHQTLFLILNYPRKDLRQLHSSRAQIKIKTRKIYIGAFQSSKCVDGYRGHANQSNQLAAMKKEASKPIKTVIVFGTLILVATLIQMLVLVIKNIDVYESPSE
jgi:hypothetical protein